MPGVWGNPATGKTLVAGCERINMNADDIIIDHEFESLLPYTDSTEDALLEQAVVGTSGPTDPLVLWGDSNILIDGHRRLKICVQHDLPFKTISEPLETREEVKVWMLFRQLARRNLRDHSRPRLVRELYDRIRGASSRHDGNAAEKIARVIGTTRRSVYRYLETQKAIEKLIPGWQVQAERIGLSKAITSELGKYSNEDQEMLLDECTTDCGSISRDEVPGRLREALSIVPQRRKSLPYSVTLPDGVEVGEFQDPSFKAGYASKKEINAKIAEARRAFSETKRLAEELTGKYYLDSGIMRQRMLASVSRIQACLKYLAENAHKRPSKR